MVTLGASSEDQQACFVEGGVTLAFLGCPLCPGRVGFLGGSDSKKSSCKKRRLRFDPWVEKISWRREWLPIPLFLPGEFHGQRSLVGYSPWGRKESDTTEATEHSTAPDRNTGS